MSFIIRYFSPLLLVFLVSCADIDQAEVEAKRVRNIFEEAYQNPALVELHRFSGNPIIEPSMLEGDAGKNINGPSLVRVPEWVDNRLGEYYLYFAHHTGRYIRLAYADDLSGPWTIYEPGVLPLAKLSMIRGHVASPDVLIDHEEKRFRLYFHGPVNLANQKPGQYSFVATSEDGLSFEAKDEVLGLFYFRVFEYQDKYFALAKGGRLYSSVDGLKGFQDLGDTFPVIPNNKWNYNKPGSVRHLALYVGGDILYVFYTRIGDSPERILLSTIDLTQPVSQWSASDPVELLKPQKRYEGAHLPLEAGKAGAKYEPINAVRDPAVFVENGRVYLLYSIAGEKGIAIAELRLL